ncbi:hypothetical protein CALCODRAFT_479913 [Calocera cornea HHB12733]|uniref:Uncharacterized protein n=1 Tax=Calocera cornea HHB12733 TaxID=1353952 RepID=A0A165J5W5_9BASI|nr:hypothetical protein CALCODRAFT_479913 [Calocera cornea HHB12733]
MSYMRANPSDQYPSTAGSALPSATSTLRQPHTQSSMRPAHRAEATGATVSSANGTSGAGGVGGANGPASGSPPLSHAPPTSQQETEAMRQAVLALVNVWLSRLSLLSGITTFFAGIDGQLLSYAYPSAATDGRTDTGYKIAVTSLAGAMILHWMAAIISYIACFALYRYELIDARNEERTSGLLAFRAPAPGSGKPFPANLSTPQLGSSIFSAPLQLDAAYISVSRLHPYTFRTTRPTTTFPTSPFPGTSNPTLTLPITHGIPRLPMDLRSVNDACVGLTVVGFGLALLGILAYMWTFLPVYVSGFASACLAVGVAVGLWVLR